MMEKPVVLCRSPTRPQAHALALGDLEGDPVDGHDRRVAHAEFGAQVLDRQNPVWAIGKLYSGPARSPQSRTGETRRSAPGRSPTNDQLRRWMATGRSRAGPLVHAEG